MKNFSSQKNFNPKMFLWTRRMQFWQTLRIKFDKIRMLLTQISKVFRDEKFFLNKNFFLDEVFAHAEGTFDNPVKSTRRTFEKISSRLEKNQDAFVYLSWSFSLKTYVRKRRMHFWQTCQKGCAFTLKMFCSKSKQNFEL